MKNLKNLVLGAFVLNAASLAMAQAQIEWDASRAVVAGCDAVVTSSNGDLSIVAVDLAVDLGNSKADRKSCAIRVPVSIPLGYYISKLTHKINYEVEKSARSSGGISERSTFFNLPVMPLSVDFRQGHALNTVGASESRTDVYDQVSDPSWVGSMCSDARSETGLFQYNIAISAQKSSANEIFYASADGLELKAGVDYELSRCP